MENTARRRTGSRWSGLLSGLLLVLWTATLGAQPCDPDLIPAPGPTGYQNRDGRCEGVFAQGPVPVGIDLAGFTDGDLSFPLASKTTIRVDCPVLSDRPVRIRAVGMDPRSRYQMDAVLKPGGHLDWPVGDVLWPLRLSPGKVGIYGWREGPDGPVYVPVRVRTGDASASTTDRKVTFRAGVDLTSVRWRQYPAEGDRSSAQSGIWRDAPRDEYRAGRPIDIPVALEDGGTIRVEVAGRQAAGKLWFKRTVRLYGGGG